MRSRSNARRRPASAMATIGPFASQAPRPKSLPSRSVRRNGIAGPAAANGNRVHMRVESETRASAVVDPPENIGAAVRQRAYLCGETHGFESDARNAAASTSRPGGFCVSMATSRSSRPVRRATSGSGAVFATFTALSPSPRLHRRFRLAPAWRHRCGRRGSSLRRRGWE